MEFVHGEGLLREEEQILGVLTLATTIFQPFYDRPLAIYPVVPSGYFAIDQVYQLTAETNSVHLLEQQALEDPPRLRIVFRLESLANALDVKLKPFHEPASPPTDPVIRFGSCFASSMLAAR
jgi:hypothetical protein